ncbi:hypothetical protein DVH24_021912 [Malus domestica]|uniref:Knottin scorpion toxin-like domain-containing protein n=1 Tax=Malus domestica TaxID=3750 RepID=A0A498ITN8_MALDO|nr:hypothetical protein DVH24_021912 [Malus domestica]
MATFVRKLFVLVLTRKLFKLGIARNINLLAFASRPGRICNRKCINQGYEGGKCSAFLCACDRPCPT